MLGYQTGVVGGIAQMHAAYYHQHHGFGEAFEAKVASDLADFAPRLKYRCNQLWTRWEKDRVTASLAIDGQALGRDKGLLRWFLVDPKLQGLGIGKSLLKKALNFSDAQGMKEIELWTFEGLDAARALYEAFGFELVFEDSGDQWGRTVKEQKFVRLNPSAL